MATNRPRSRVKNVTTNSKGVKKRGSGLGTGPVGSTGGSVGGSTDSASAGGQRATRAGGKGGLIKIILINSV